MPMKHSLAIIFPADLPVVFLLFLCLLLATPAGAGYDEGMAAHSRGDYAAALREWRPLAEQGNADAQYNLGYMYENAQGLPLDHA
ncbi:MAG: hypothetical protein O3C49_08845, partial [Proteobacteria bacterium]|nr:hypothetical protein [Pseudomonadota bacterium]